MIATVIDPAGIDTVETKGAGTGPFTVGERVLGQRIRLVANKSYWRPGEPIVSEVVFTIFSDNDAANAALESGAADMIYGGGGRAAVRLRDAGYQLIQGPGPLVSFPGQRVFGLKSDVFLANLYYDIDTRSRFTPYFGVGLGFAHNKTTNGTVVDTGNIGFTNAVIAGDSKWATAGALMGGFSFAMRDRLHLDAGYRYLYVGDARTGLITGTVAPLQNPGNDGDPVVKDIWSHEFRIGLRYDIR